MSAVNPHLWWLLLLALTPILIHLLIRRRAQRVPWAAMTFLLQAMRRNRRKTLLETILLLLTRTAAVLALALLFIRPLSDAGWSAPGGQRQRASVVIVLDDSAGMAAGDGVQTRFGRAVARLEQYLEALPGGSEVSVLLAAEPPLPLVRRPTRDIAYVRELIEAREPRDSGAALAPALLQAADWLEQSNLPAREVVVLTDGQRAAWENEGEALRTALQAAGEVAVVALLATPQTPAGNVAVAELTVAGGPDGLAPDLATSLWPTTVRVTLQPYHLTQPRETAVTLLVDGQNVARQRASVEPGRPSVVTFEHRFRSPGAYDLTAAIEDDLVPRDDRRHGVLQVREQLRVLLVEGGPAVDAAASATGFARAALWAAAADDSDATPRLARSGLFSMRTVTVSELEGSSLDGIDLVLLADVPGLPAPTLARLRAAVRNGAGLLVVYGPQSSAEGLTVMLTEGDDPLLPVTFGQARALDDDAERLNIIPRLPLSPVLEAFDDPSLAEALSRCGWRLALPVQEAREGVRLPADFHTGGAAMALAEHGAGRVMYLGAPLDRNGGDAPLSPAFVPLVQQLAFHLTRQAGAVSTPAGSPVDFPALEDGAVLHLPDGGSIPATVALTAATNGARLLPERAGVYVLRDEGGQTLARRAVNPSPAAFDVATLEMDAWRGLLPPGVTLVAADEPLQARLRAARTASEWSSLALLVLLALLATELCLLWAFAPRRVDADTLLQQATRL